MATLTVNQADLVFILQQIKISEAHAAGESLYDLVGNPLLPWGLSLAAGAMLFVVLSEIIPASRARGYEGVAGLGLLVGFCLMMVLDTALV